MSSKAFIPMMLILLAGCQRAPDAPPAPIAAASGPTGTVTIEVNGVGSKETIVVDDVEEGSTVEDVMRSITEPEISITGSGITAFVDRIGDVSTNSTEGWTYKVDGEFANEGIGSMTLSPPTTITWTFSDSTAFESN